MWLYSCKKEKSDKLFKQVLKIDAFIHLVFKYNNEKSYTNLIEDLDNFINR